MTMKLRPSMLPCSTRRTTCRHDCNAFNTRASALTVFASSVRSTLNAHYIAGKPRVRLVSCDDAEYGMRWARARE